VSVERVPCRVLGGGVVLRLRASQTVKVCQYRECPAECWVAGWC